MFEKKPVSRQVRSLPFRLKALSAVVLSTALLSTAYGASLGKINVLSALGQPLQAEIELHSTTREQADNLKIRLASLETFRVANIEYNPVLSAFRFAVAESNGKPVIRISSTRPVNEPFVDLLLEVEDGGGRLVREYTFILDPADLRMPQPIQMANPVVPAPALAPTPPVPVPAPRAQNEARDAAAPTSPVAAQAQSAVQEQSSVAQRSAPAARVTPQPQEAISETTQTRTVVRGDTLHAIARAIAPEGVSLDQMLVALHRANPHAFVGDNMNRLRTGRILTVPEAEVARAVPETKARQIVIAQANDFSRYKERLASQVAASAPVAGEAARQSDSGRITTQVEELGSQTSAARDRLQLSKPGITGTDGDHTAALAAGAEEQIAQEKALVEANARIAELERNLNAMQRLLQLQNQELADRQALSQTVAEQSASPSVAPAEPGPTEPDSAALTAAETAAGEADLASVPSDEEVAPVAAAPVTNVSAAEKPAASMPVAVPPMVEAPSFLEHILGHPLLLPLAGVLAALGGVGIVVRRRRKQQDALVRDSFVQGNSLFGSTGGQSVDTNNSVFSTNFSPSASQLDTNEVDPIAEADVYIAYQKDDQAEEILKDALRVQPARHNVRLKLLEIYRRLKDPVAFAACAHEMYALTHGRGENWLQAALLGRELDPENPLYADAEQAKEMDRPNNEELDLGSLLNSTRMPGGDDGSLSMASGGMNYGLDQPEVADASSISFGLGLPADDGDAGDQVWQVDSGSELNEWNVDHDIDQMKAEADQSPLSFQSDDEAAREVNESPDENDEAANKPLEFDISDMGFDLNLGAPDEKSAAQGGKDLHAVEGKSEEQDIVDPLAELLTSSTADNSAEEFGANSADHIFGMAASSRPSSSKQAAEEPILDLDMDMPTLPRPGAYAEQEDDLGLSMPEGSVRLNDNGQMWEESQDEISLAQPTVPVPALGPISAETELSTKLDLALAYREIGDKEGARELLEEVASSGQAIYAAKAQDLLKKIA